MADYELETANSLLKNPIVARTSEVSAGEARNPRCPKQWLAVTLRSSRVENDASGDCSRSKQIEFFNRLLTLLPQVLRTIEGFEGFLGGVLEGLGSGLVLQHEIQGSSTPRVLQSTDATDREVLFIHGSFPHEPRIEGDGSPSDTCQPVFGLKSEADIHLSGNGKVVLVGHQTGKGENLLVRGFGT
jgi:hypothetical protein